MAAADASRAPPAAWFAVKPFVFGGLAASFATACIQPVDFLKVRLQLEGEGGAARRGPITLARDVIAKEGFLTAYTGLSAAIFRQLTYGTARLGIFRTLSDKMTTHYDGKVPAYMSALSGIAAGIGGSMIGTPADVALVRMQADNNFPKELRRNYKGVFDAIGRIAREEGLRTLWSGNVSNIARGVAISVGQLSSYEQIRQVVLQHMQPGVGANLLCAGLAGITAAVCCAPFDFVKTRMQKQRPGPDGRLPYTGVVDCLRKSMATEGLLSPFTGLSVLMFRVGPHAMIVLMSLEYFNSAAKSKGW